MPVTGIISDCDACGGFMLNAQRYMSMNDAYFAPSHIRFPSLADFNAGTDALKCTDLEQNVVYQIVSTRTVNTQHGQLVILSLQKADGSSCSAWACGMLSTELLQNHMVMISSRLFVLAENEQEWTSLQFVSAAAVLNLFM